MLYNKLQLSGRQTTKMHGGIVYAKNKVFDTTKKSIKTECGFDLILTTDFTINGLTTNNKEIILFGIDVNGKGVISIFNYTTLVHTIIIRSAYINFNILNPIIATTYVNYNDETVVQWIDGISSTSNNIRICNLQVLPFKSGLTGAKELVNPAEITLLDLYPNLTVPLISLNSVPNTGNLQTGTYIIYVAYEFQDNRISKWLNQTHSIYVIQSYINYNSSDEALYRLIQGGQGGLLSNKSIVLDVTAIPTYVKNLKLGIIHSKNNVLTAYTKSVIVTNTSLQVTLSSMDMEIVPLTTILNIPTIYKKGYAITQFDNKSIIGNLTINDRINYQPFANNINVKWISQGIKYYKEGSINPSDTFKSELKTYIDKSFMPNEVYALYIQLILLDASETEWFHIPGNTSDKYDAQILNKTTLLSELGSSVPYYRVECTAESSGLLGYWENQNEIYPNTEDSDVYEVNIDGSYSYLYTNRNTPVRHFKFPDKRNLLKWGHINDFNNTSPSLGIVVSNIKFPTIIANKIQGYRIGYAKRDVNNSTVIDESIIHNIYNYYDDYDGHKTKKRISGMHSTGGYFGNENNDRSTGTIVNDEVVLFPFKTLKNNDSLLFNYLHFNYAFDKRAICTNKYEYGASLVGSTVLIKKSYIIGATNQLLNVQGLGVHDINLTYYLDGFTNTLEPDYTDVDSAIISNIPIIDKVYIGRSNTYNNVINELSDTVVYGKLPTGRYFDATNYNWAEAPENLFLSSGLFTNVTMMVYKTDCYNSFKNQDVVICSDFINKTISSQNLYNGDTYVGIKSYKLIPTYYKDNAVDEGSTLTIDGITIEHDTVCFVQLFVAYGFPYYSTINIELRHKETDIYYPNFDIYSDFETWLNSTTILNNTYFYNYDYSKVNDLLYYLVYNSENRFISKYGKRFIISNSNKTESLLLHWAIFDNLSYMDTAYNKGDIVYLNANDRFLYIQKRNTLNYLSIEDTLTMGDGKVIELQNKSLLDIVLKEILTTDKGYISTTERFANIFTVYGFFTYSSDRLRIYKILGDKVEDITIGIQDYLESKKQYLLASNSNPYNHNGIILGYDDKEENLIFSLSDTGLEPETGEDEVDEENSVLGNSFTLSYKCSEEAWVSFHVYLPYMMLNLLNKTFSIKYKKLYKHNSDTNTGKYYMNKLTNTYTIHSDVIDYIFNSVNTENGYTGKDINKIFNNFKLHHQLYLNKVYKPHTGIDRIAVYNDTQCSGYIDVISGNWFNNIPLQSRLEIATFDKFKDIVINNTIPILDSRYDFIINNLKSKNWFENSNFISKFVIIRLVHNNTGMSLSELYIDDIDVDFNINSK